MINTVVIDDERRNRFIDFYWQFSQVYFSRATEIFIPMIDMTIEHKMKVAAIFLYFCKLNSRVITYG